MPSSNRKQNRQKIGVSVSYRKDQYQDNAMKGAEELLKSINENTTNVRNLYITYVLLALYIFLIVGGTNDEQLLKDSTIAVPFLSNVNLPVSRFYLWTPWIFLFVHIDLLLLFKLLASKLHVFTDQLDKLSLAQSIDLRRRVYGSLFTHWLAGEHSDRFSLLITGIVIWSSIFALPLVTFGALQVGFLPYHSSFITTTQQILLSVDTLALIWFWPRLAGLSGQNTLTWWLFNRETPSLLRRLITLTSAHICQENSHKTKVRPSCAGLCPTISFLVILMMQGFSWGVATLPGVRQEDNTLLVRLLTDHPPYFGWSSLFVNNWSKDYRTASFQLTNLGDQCKQQPTCWLITYFLNIENQRDLDSLIQRNPWIQKFESSLPWFHRNLNLREKILIANTPDLETINTLMSTLATPEQLKAAINRIAGLDLNGRDLRFANLNQTKLWHANLRNSNLQNTNLNWSQLQSADLQQAQLQGANLSAARMWGVDLYKANLQGADLTSAELQGTNLVGADLLGASLRDSKLQGADIDTANLQGANLNNADLRGVEFWQAYLLGANFSSAAVGSASFGNDAQLGLNDWRKIIETPKFTKQDLKGWQNTVFPFIRDAERAKGAEESLKRRLDKITSFGELDGYDEHCMTDGKILALQVCKNINNAHKYFESLESYLARLICDEDEFGEKSDFILEGVAKRVVGPEMNLFNPMDACSETGVDCKKLKKLAEDLLKGCSGKFNLSTQTRIRLTSYISDSPDQYPATKAAP